MSGTVRSVKFPGRPSGAVCAVLILLLAVLAPGCSRDDGETEKKILVKDQSFQTVLKKRDFLNAELLSLKAAYIKITGDIDAEIAALRAKRARTRKEYIASAEKIRLQFQPEVRKIEREITDVQRRYDQKATELKQIEKDASEVGDLIKKKDKLILTEEEMKTWNDRLNELSLKKAAVLAEMSKIREELQLDRMKLKVMRLR